MQIRQAESRRWVVRMRLHVCVCVCAQMLMESESETDGDSWLIRQSGFRYET